jgi:TonB-dependent Receptor Plug Domain
MRPSVWPGKVHRAAGPKHDIPGRPDRLTPRVPEASVATMPSRPGRGSLHVLAAVLFVGGGCGRAMPRDPAAKLPAGTFLITAEQIARSGAHTAWEVVRQQAPMLQAEDDENGRPAKLIRRGRSSFLLDDSPMVIVDEVRLADFRNLDLIDAQSISALYVLDAIAGASYGANSGSGVILIKTKDGRHS